MEKMEVDESAETEMENIKESEEKCSKNQGGKKAGKNLPPGIRQNYELHPIAPENDLLHQYYLGQGIISDEEWMAFAETLKIDLPSSFRIRLSLQERDHLVGYIESKFIKEISNIAESEDGLNSQLDPPKPVSFVPYAYQTKMSRQAIRSHPILKEFHEFLINETELGYISRQEVCSMIPPLLLEIEPHHVVLDACAAPGSKTMQILELMHKKPNPEGMLIANDIDYKRCYLLVHQTLKRIPSANCVVTSHDSAQFPTVFGPDQKPILFDRILCDLICSGDGTFRKNPELWRTWEPMKGINLHKLQLKIAQRCVELLKPGGMMCYSTCSLNPVEDEAIVVQILRTNEDKMELIDVSNKLPGLKRTPGINKWKVYNKNLKEYCSPEDVPQQDRRHFKPSMFPPSKEECEKMHLERTFRILPHHQNTGGFFIAILRKKDSSDTDKGVEESKPVATVFAGKPTAPKRRRFINKEDPFVFLEERNEDNGLREEMKLHFGICGFPYENLLVRSKNTERKKEIYFVNDRLRQFLKYNADRFKIVNAGMGVLKKITSDKVAPCSYRLKQDGLALLSPWITKRILNIPVELMTKILAGGTKQANGKEEHSQYVSMEEIGQHSALFKELDPGSVVLCMHQPFNKQICAWIGANSVSAFVSREERFHLLSILGEDVQKFRRNADTTRQEKAKRIKGQTDAKNVVGNNEEEHSI